MAKRKRKNQDTSSLWLYGRHAVSAALGNPARRCHELLLADGAARSPAEPVKHPDRPPPKIVERRDIERHLPPGARHQGIAARFDLLAPYALETLVSTDPGARLVIVLDQITDPRNVGAILRSAAAFGAAAVITTDAHAPPETGALASAASGALERMPYVRVVNLARALETLADAGFWRVGLDPRASGTLDDITDVDRIALILGSEDKGMRKLTRKCCDFTAHLPMSSRVESLNVSNAAAIALYELARRS